MTQKRRLWLALLALVMLDLALRLYRLDYQEMRGDEAFSVMFAKKDPDGILTKTVSTTEPHPPLSFFLLHFWMILAGRTEFALRFSSLFFGVAAVPLVYRLGRQLWSEEVGLWAAVLLTLNPFQIWHAQEARMYAMSTALGLASAVCLLLALEKGRLHHWAGYVIATTVSIYTHYYALFLASAEAIFVLLFWRRHRSRLRAWLIAQASIFLLYLPWLLFAWRILVVYHGNADSPTLVDMLNRCWQAFSLGLSLPTREALIFSPLWIAALAVGMWKSLRRNVRPLSFALLYLGLPVLSVYLSSLRRPVFNERYLIAATPPYYVLLGAGLAELRRWARDKRSWVFYGGLLLAFLVTGHSLYNHYFVPAYSKTAGWRALTSHLDAAEQPGDVVVQNYPDPTLDYYYQADAPLIALPSAFPVDEAATAQALEELADSQHRIWFLPYRAPTWDAEGFVSNWLDRYCDKVQEQQVASFRLDLYLTPQSFLPTMQPLDVVLGDDIHLLGYRLEGDDGDLTFAPEETVYLTLYWRTQVPLHMDYTVFTHLLDATGWLRGQQDNPPVYGTYPTGQWAVGEIIVDKYDIVLEAGAPPGTYALELGMYNPTTMDRLPVQDEEGKNLGDHVLLSGAIEVQ
jgi:mannosyltransferase